MKSRRHSFLHQRNLALFSAFLLTAFGFQNCAFRLTNGDVDLPTATALSPQDPHVCTPVDSMTPPIAINSVVDLEQIKNNLGARYILTSDLDLSSIANWVSIGGVDSQGMIDPASAPFCGSLDGNGHTISNLQTQRGLFGMLLGTVSNLTLRNATIVQTFHFATDASGHIANTPDYLMTAGLLAAQVQGFDPASVLVQNVTVEGSIRGNQLLGVGAIAGVLAGATVQNSQVQLVVDTTSVVNGAGGNVVSQLIAIGGVAGLVGSGIIDGVTASVTIHHADGDVGGLVGQMIGETNQKPSIVKNSNATIVIDGSSSAASIGGIVGDCTNCSLMSVQANVQLTAPASILTLGGLIGRSNSFSLAHVSASGTIAAQYGSSVLIGADASGNSSICDASTSLTNSTTPAGAPFNVFVGTSPGPITVTASCP